MKKYLLCFYVFIQSASPVLSAPVSADSVKFICREMLGRPTNNSITVNLCSEKDIEAYIEYGTDQNQLNRQTAVKKYSGLIPFNIIIDNLLPNNTYFYRVKYRTGTAEYIARNIYSFKTQKTPGSKFTFAVEADPHLDGATDPVLYYRTLRNILVNQPDFMFDLGDTFMSEKLTQQTQDSVTIRHLYLRSFFDSTCHSVPLFFVLGNHEGELGWLLNGTANNLAVMTTNTRLKYYINPLPDNFYSGNTKSEPFVGLRQNYYSFEWGSALFVVIDPYWYTSPKPSQNITNWNWTLGRDQYLWFKNVLEKSKAKFKFVFAHQVVGGLTYEGRGGSEAVPFYEMGGKNADNTWGFSTSRPGWELPIHQLMVKNHVNIYFHGHDHFYAKQELDGIIYQEVPQPGNANYKTAQNAANYGYLSGKIIPNSGFLKVTVTDTTAVIDYVRSYLPSVENNERINGGIDFSYTINSASATLVEQVNDNPGQFQLMQNYPNPFNPETKIQYSVASAQNIRIQIFDILGREVGELVNQYQQPGTYSIPFNIAEFSITSGIYFYRLTAGGFSKTLKMNILK